MGRPCAEVGPVVFGVHDRKSRTRRCGVLADGDCAGQEEGYAMTIEL